MSEGGPHQLLDRPIFVIGAARSGTTMIREALLRHRDVVGFRFEINDVWRQGNNELPHDILDPEHHLTEQISERIRMRFRRELDRGDGIRILDKTVANVMRPAFVQAVFPGARILHVIRDGRAVTASAIKRWAAPRSLGYLVAKARTVPLRSLPAILARQFAGMVRARAGGRDYRHTWGPRWPGIDEAVRDLPLTQVCARQWRNSVSSALSQKDDLRPGSYMEVRYEQLVEEPATLFPKILEFFELPPDDPFSSWIDQYIEANRQHRWRHELTKSDLDLILEEIGPLLEALGYS